MKYRCDLHIHSCLSPCAADEMTPCNLAGMAKLLGLDMIALTDHNSAGNCRAAVQAGAEAGVAVVPGMELCCAEEIHVVALFPDADAAESFSAMVRGTLPPIRNRAEVFGRQLLMDAQDNILGEEALLLAAASSISIDDMPRLCREYGGVCFPAHIDRPSYSILAVFGMMDASMGFSCFEATAKADMQALCAKNPDLRQMRRLCSSDAHALEMMVTEEEHFLELPVCTPQAVIALLSAEIQG